MRTLNIFLDLDISKCGYAIFVNSEYKDSGVIKSTHFQRLMEKPTGQLKSTEPQVKVKLNKDNFKIGEWRKDPPTGKWRYWSIKWINFKFNNDIDRAERMTSILIDMIISKEYGEVNKFNIYIEDSNSSHRKLEYIGMVKAYLWEGVEYRFRYEDSQELVRFALDEIFNINVSSIKNKLKNAYLTLVRKRNVDINVSDIILRDNKYLSKELVKLTFNKSDIVDDEADAINMMFYLDKVWYLKNLKE